MTRIPRAAALALALLMVLAASAAALPQDGGDTVLAVCTRCHDTKRICKNLGKRDAAWWSAKVGLMIGKGAALDPQGKEAVVAWLGSRKAGDRPVCE